MSTSATLSAAAGVTPVQRLEVLFAKIAELSGQRNAIDGRIVEIIAEINRDGLAGITGFRSVASLVAAKTGVSPNTAHTFTTIAQRAEQFPQCVAGMREGWLSVDQLGAVVDGAADGSDAHYAQFARYATVTQIRKAVRLEPPPAPKPEPEPAPEPEAPRSITTTHGPHSTTWHITLPTIEAAEFQAGLQSHHDKLVAEWKRAHAENLTETTPPFPTPVDGFLSLMRAGWDADAAARPHGQRTTVVIHVDVESRLANLHLGPVLADADRQYLLCDATCEVWFERDGQPIGAGRETRTINRRLRRALEHRDHGTCVVPGCGATRGLHAHHLIHWEDGGPTELDNLVLVCPYHHRLHHKRGITLTGPASRLVVTDATGRHLTNRSLARPPTTAPPQVAPHPGPGGARCDWWWYTPYQPPAAS
ncbi:HNH endonuclease signature motif containing protein [Mycolicibacterium tokaiense]|uniref:IclR family transcriptional regulator n=1 Tax=Mycolicibacterium tokaiense TaxID=39695 RepID=A0A378TM11_9MYCO|nr:HNH endonuclease signature motif containing protein [Mycolicibacterium tokaiense]BBY84255.1 hypothetical protein MTOK_00370 [Mycolicibacterium tokaiense]STZ61237.1 IclR family transcriptional regulator [Mycolicibacterium tokaiense]